MYQGRWIAGAARHITAICLAALVFLIGPLSCAFAAQPAKSTAPSEADKTPAKVRELLTLLADPKVQEWLDKEAKAKLTAANSFDYILKEVLFLMPNGQGSACTASQSAYDQIVQLDAQTYVDTTPGASARELRVSSSVYLRNQNQAPVASFVSTPSSTSRTVVLNGAGSSDFEGRTLNYYWFKTTMPAAASIDCGHPTVTGSATPRTLWGSAGFLGEGITLNHTFPASDGAANTNIAMGLVVCDPGDRYGLAGISPAAAITVSIPT